MNREDTGDHPLRSLRAVVASTEAVKAALHPLDVDALDKALAARADALRELGAAAAGADGSPWAAEARDLAAAALAADASARRAVDEARQTLRDELVGVAGAGQALSGYRAVPTPAPRFADRKG